MAGDRPSCGGGGEADPAVSASKRSTIRPYVRDAVVTGRRPKLTPRRAKRINVRVSDDEYADIERAAKAAGLGLGAYLAGCARAATTGAMSPAERGQRLELMRSVLKARTQLARIGTNLNQIALALNSSETVHDAQLAVVLDRVEQALVNADAAVSDMQRRSR